ncbi:hypothetical protein LOC68_10620 [Blastopirellula sp. JC732]|uniref:Secreted protein n=1 Tax=Blastopirellula sediminis TaxID=2894196 RepID=A0A9X1MMX9_9BACT|nr:hypothetical protein [Blastopirellula sediminis]MCC9608371.1 hypothetical protein [Blastopirellula sediminis]MCC9628852.1 hypothetical protein [Blastopirellula sediminis]
MRPKLISPLLILVLLSCPLWCSWASAQGISCCDNHSEPTAAPADEPACCCCQKENSPPPAQRHSDESHCQGICGGAVLDGDVTVELPLPLSLDFPRVIDVQATLTRQVQAYASSRNSHSSAQPTGTLRAQHVLILC